MFIKEHGAAAILLAIVFMSLGFVLGKVTSHHGGQRGCKGATFCPHSSQSCSQSIPPPPFPCNHVDKKGSQHMIIVEAMMEEGFEGDTVLTIPGGSIHLSIDGEDVDVNVELDVDDHNHGDH